MNEPLKDYGRAHQCGHHYAPSECPYDRCGYRDLLTACKQFRQRRGTHPGVQHETAEFRPCGKCEESYVQEEAVLDAAIDASDDKREL